MHVKYKIQVKFNLESSILVKCKIIESVSWIENCIICEWIIQIGFVNWMIDSLKSSDSIPIHYNWIGKEKKTNKPTTRIFLRISPFEFHSVRTTKGFLKKCRWVNDCRIFILSELLLLSFPKGKMFLWL